MAGFSSNWVKVIIKKPWPGRRAFFVGKNGMWSSCLISKLLLILLKIPLKFDDFVKSPSAALRCILSHCGVHASTPHSFVFARLASEAFYFIV